MAWTSNTFSRSSETNPTRTPKQVEEAAASHKGAKDKVVNEAREYSRSRHEALSTIKDPALRKSVTKQR